MLRRKPQLNFDDTNSNVGSSANPSAANQSKKRRSSPQTTRRTTTKAAEDAQALKDEDDRQEGLAKELLRLTSSLKHNFTAAGSVLKEDNAALDVMQHVASSNKENLVRESGRLQHHAYQSCFNCVMIMTVVFVIWSFIAMIIVMRVFQKAE